MKKEYTKPITELTRFTVETVFTTSGGNGDGDGEYTLPGNGSKYTKFTYDAEF